MNDPGQDDSVGIQGAYPALPFIGIDMEAIARFEKYDSPEKAMRLGCFTEREIEYSFRHKRFAQHLAARFCAKEAAYKALFSMGIDQPSLMRIEIISAPGGCPSLIFHDESLTHIDVRVSLSHTKTDAIAMVILSKKCPEKL